MSVEQAVVRTDRDPEGADSMRTEEGYSDWVKIVDTQFELFRRVWSSLPGCQMALNVKVNSLLGRRIDISGRGWTKEQIERARLRYRKMVEEYMRDTTCYGIFLCTINERTRLPHRIDPATVRIWTRRTADDIGEYVVIRPENGPTTRRVRMTGVAVFERCKPLPNGSLDSPLRPLLPEIRLANAARVCSIIAMRQNAYPLMFTTVKAPDDPGTQLQRAQDTGEFLDHARTSLTQHELDAQRKARDYAEALQRSMALQRQARLSADPTHLGMGALLDEETDTLTFDLLGTEEPNLHPLPLGATPVAATAAQEPASLVVTNARIDALTCRIMGVSPAVLGGGENKSSGAEGSVTGMVIGYTEMAAAERHQLTSLFNILAPATADGIDIGLLCNNQDVQEEGGKVDDQDDSRTVDSYDDRQLGWNLPDSILKQFASMAGERNTGRLFRRDGPRTLVRRGAAMRVGWVDSRRRHRPFPALAASADVSRSKRHRPRKQGNKKTKAKEKEKKDDSSTSTSESDKEDKGDSSSPSSSSSEDGKEKEGKDEDDDEDSDSSSALSNSSSSSATTSSSSDAKEEKDEKATKKRKPKRAAKSSPSPKKTKKEKPKAEEKKLTAKAKRSPSSSSGSSDPKARQKKPKGVEDKEGGEEDSKDDGPEKQESKKKEKKKRKTQQRKDASSARASSPSKGKEAAATEGEGEDLETERKRLEMERKERLKEMIETRRAMMKLQAEEEEAQEKKAERTRRRQLQTVSSRLRERANQTGTSVRLPSHLRTLAQGGKRGPLETRLGPQVEVNSCIEYMKAGLITVKQATDVLVDVHGFVEAEMPTELLDPVTQRPMAETADLQLQSGLQMPGGGMPASGNDRVAPRGLQAPGLREKKPGAASAAHHGIQSK